MVLIRLVLLQHEFDLHRAGVLHGDVAYRNFVKGSQGIRLIDFDRARAHSACPYYETERRTLTLENANTPLACVELDTLRVWFGFCERWDLSSKQWARFVPWDGPPWGSDAPVSLEGGHSDGSSSTATHSAAPQAPTADEAQIQ